MQGCKIPHGNVEIAGKLLADQRQLRLIQHRDVDADQISGLAAVLPSGKESPTLSGTIGLRLIGPGYERSGKLITN